MHDTTPQSLPDGPNHDLLPNFCAKQDLCSHVDSIQAQKTAEYHALGYIASRECTKHLIYLDQSAESKDSSLNLAAAGETTTLSDLFTRGDLTQSKIASISKQLAIAALQYHATPWIETWDGDHVLLMTERNASDASDVSDVNAFESSIDVSIRKPEGEPHTPISSRSKTLIPNWTLLRLGIMLVELAYHYER